MNTYIIAELGVNHNGKIELAKQLIDVAVDAGADAVKFQMYATDELVSEDAPLVDYQCQSLENITSQKQLLDDLKLSKSQFVELHKYSTDRKIDFLCTPFDINSLKFLVEDLNLETIKIASPDITNAQLLYNVGKYKVEVILSTGMCVLDDIEFALGVLASAFVSPEIFPTESQIKASVKKTEAQRVLREKVTLLHCTSDYPTKLKDVNLRAIKQLSDAFGLKVGYSDHTKSLEVPLGEVAMEAKVIEKHLTIDTDMEGPDHDASFEPSEFREMVTKIRLLEEALGKVSKYPSNAEISNRGLLRRSIFAKTDIARDEEFTENNLMVTRPESGISSRYFYEYVGKNSTKDYRKGQAIVDPAKLSR